jgi:hypothetical protein
MAPASMVGIERVPRNDARPCRGDGTFQAPRTLAVGTDFFSVAVGDFSFGFLAYLGWSLFRTDRSEFSPRGLPSR